MTPILFKDKNDFYAMLIALAVMLGSIFLAIGFMLGFIIAHIL